MTRRNRARSEYAQTIAETIEDFQLKIAADFYLGVARFTLGDYRQAEGLCRKVVQSLAGDLSHKRFRLTEVPASGCYNYLALTLAELGEFDEGISHGQEAIQLAEAANHPFSLVLACWGLAYLYALRGEFSPAVRLLERGLDLSRECDLTALSPRVMGFLGSLYARSQRIAEGLPLLHEALKEMETLGLGGYHSLLVADLGEAYLFADRLEEALTTASRALALARSRGERGYEAWALRLLGDIAARADQPGIDQAETHYHDASALADELGMRPLMAHCHLGLGKLYYRTGDGAKAQQSLTTAATMYRAMDMGFWLEKAEAELMTAQRNSP